jgi:hypothetical protein
MFIQKDAALARAANTRAASLLDRRKDLIASLKAHIEQVHEQAGTSALCLEPEKSG